MNKIEDKPVISHKCISCDSNNAHDSAFGEYLCDDCFRKRLAKLLGVIIAMTCFFGVIWILI